MTTPTTTDPAEYHRRAIAPTATAEQVAAQLTVALAAIEAAYRPLVTESTNAVIEGHGFEVAEQVVADLEHIHDITHDWLKVNNVADVHTADGLGDLLIGLVPVDALNDALDEHSADRIADNRARERWMCAKYGIDPDNIDRNMAVTDLEARCHGDKEAMVTIIEMHGRRSLHPPEVRIGVVLDNFSPHLSTTKDARVGKWAAANNVELAYTPTYSSWLNRIEAQFQALRYFALQNPSGVDHGADSVEDPLRAL